MVDMCSTRETLPTVSIREPATAGSGCRAGVSTTRPPMRTKRPVRTPLPRPLVGCLYFRHLQKFFVIRCLHPAVPVCRRFASQEDAVAVPFDGNHFAADSFIQKTEPMLSRFRCFDSFHVYNVQRVAWVTKSWTVALIRLHRSMPRCGCSVGSRDHSFQNSCG